MSGVRRDHFHLDTGDAGEHNKQQLTVLVGQKQKYCSQGCFSCCTPMQAKAGVVFSSACRHCAQSIKGLTVAKENVSYSLILSINKLCVSVCVLVCECVCVFYKIASM